MVHSLFLYSVNDSFDVDAIKRHLEANPNVFIDPLGTPTYIMCGGPETVELRREKRIERPDRFPYSVLVTIQPDVINVVQEYGDEDDLHNARDFVRWIVERQPCRIEDEYGVDWTSRARDEGVNVLYAPQLS